MLWCALAESATLAGALAEGVLAPYLGPHVLQALLAIAGGSFLYLGWHAIHGEFRRSGASPALVPRAHRHRWFECLTFAAAIVMRVIWSYGPRLTGPVGPRLNLTQGSDQLPHAPIEIGNKSTYCVCFAMLCGTPHASNRTGTKNASSRGIRVAQSSA